MSKPPPLDSSGIYSVSSKGWASPREVPPGGILVEPGVGAMVRHRFPVAVDLVLIEIDPESCAFRIYAVRVGDRVVWHESLDADCSRCWVPVEPSARVGEYLVVEAAHDRESPVPLRLVLWARAFRDGDIHGMAVGYPSGDLGARRFSGARSILLLPRRSGLPRRA